ncbi:MAG TPA: sigma-70 family RNA polymerase sigma factor [Thermodesulfobacteriota bacterium]|nr:sigma-70 family RNA polymerase sigma factor [Thermodesulfobacteriota bacterium]
MDTTVTLPIEGMGIETKVYTDEELLGRIKDGDRDAFSMLVMRHTKRYYSLAYRMLSSREEAEDTVQEAFLNLWTNPGGWDSGRKSKFTTWFYRVIANACIDRKRKNTTLPMEDGFDPPDTGGGAEEAIEVRRRKENIDACIAELPESQQTALALCFYEGVSNRDAAEIMGVSVKALESLLMRAKASLRTKLGVEKGKEAEGNG